MKIAVILGTRPEIIKLSPVIRELLSRKIDFFIIHSNQHYSPAMDRIFFEELKLPHPKYNLGITGETMQGAMVAKMILGIEPILLEEKPDWVLVQGDTNTVLAGTITAAKLGIKIGHIEAGLRSNDRSMPEELNRIIADHLSNLLFCPTDGSATIADREGISAERILVTGNTIVDAVRQNIGIADSSALGGPHSLGKYILLTMHRPSNVDHPETLERLIKALQQVSASTKLPILFPVHPRTAASLSKFDIHVDPETIKLIDPVGYLEMLQMMKSSQMIITDSGGIQEEACILGVPCLTIRENTERPETVDVGANLVVGSKTESILNGANRMLNRNHNWVNPFGNGDAGAKIVSRIISF